MAITFTFAALKGGVGKSTLTVNVATVLHRAGHKTLVVDLDPQGTAKTWAAVGAENGYDGPAVVSLDGRTLRRDLAKVASAFDVVLIDTPPRAGTEARAAMLVADLVVLPAAPGGPDAWALYATLEVLEEARGMRPELRAVVVLNRADRTGLTKTAALALGELSVPLLDVNVGQRVALGEATLAGQGVVDYAPDSEAAREVRRLTAALLEAVKGDTSA